MTARYLLHSDGLGTLARYVAPDTLFAFDLDGTLAPIVEDYTAAKISAPVKATLKKLVKLAKVAVITGRSRKDALKIIGFEPHLLVGNHGAEWPFQEGNPDRQQTGHCLNWREQLHELLGYVQGVEIEFKGESISIHYRKSTDPENALSIIDTAIEKLIPVPKRIGGKFVVNLLPMDAFTKGETLLAAMDKFGLKRAIYFGDDETDEVVFKLKNVDLFGIHIGKNDLTAAQYFLNNQSELLGLLNSMAETLELHP